MSSPHRRGVHWSTWAFRALLAMYPREFRDEYGREVVMVFADRYRDAGSNWQRAVLWLQACVGVLAEAPKEHSRCSSTTSALRCGWCTGIPASRRRSC
jgi:hypothetical protein